MPFNRAPQLCWLVLAEGDWLGCGATVDDAVWLAAKVWAQEIAGGAVPDGPPYLSQAVELCVELRCAGCGGVFTDPLTGGPAHGESEVAVVALAGEHGWVGERCPACVAAEGTP
ncbi:hypothetical protein ACGFIW_01435 [Micromonospora sp. NPDC048935]|uniref:hypothetical protein n=1 Tax=Micromonospora sp. NPDC048935 TaxID=3364262 RepID=UPI00371AC015